MPTSVDERVVQMQFDNAQFEKGVDTTISSLDRLKNSLRFSGSEKNIRELERTVNNFDVSGMAESLDTASSKFSVLEQVGIAVIRRLTNEAFGFGVRLVKSLNIDNISAGFSKYEAQTKAIQSILNNVEGSTMESVQELVDRLLLYTDETSYSFDSMISNISKFTSAGIDLKVAEKSMIGIANACGLAGVETANASHAMDGFSKAMAAGYMTYQNWSWIKTAGLDTKTFKQELINAAIEEGTLKQVSEGVGKTAKNTEVSFANMTETLSEKWLTSAVMNRALGKFAGWTQDVFALAEEESISVSEAMERLGNSEMSLGEKAFRASQEARTFTDAILATKDAVSSKWAETFNYILGNKEEATELWTDLANWLWDIFAASGDARNNVLKLWRTLGGEDGRAYILGRASSDTESALGLYNLFEQISNIFESIREGFSDVFGSTEEQAAKLIEWSKKLGDFLSSIELGEETASNLRDIASGLASAFEIVGSVLQSIWTLTEPVRTIAKQVFDLILSIFGAIGRLITKSAEGENIFQNLFKNTGHMSKILESLTNFFNGEGNLSDIVGNFLGGIRSFFEELSEIIASVGVTLGISSVGELGRFGLLSAIAKFLYELAWQADTLTSNGILGTLLGDFASIWSPIGKFLDSFKAKNWAGAFKGIGKAFLMAVGGIYLLASAFSKLGQMSPEQIWAGAGALALAISEVIGLFYAFKKLDIMGSGKSAKQIGTALLLIGIAISIIAKAFKSLGDMELEGVKMAALGLLSILGLIGAFLYLMKKSKLMTIFTTSLKFAKSMVLLAVSIAIMAYAFKSLGEMSWGNYAVAIAGLGSIMVVLGLFIYLMKLAEMFGPDNKMSSFARSMVLLAISIVIMARAFSKLGEMSWGNYAVAIAGLGSIMVVLGLFIYLMKLAEMFGPDNKMLSFAGSMILLAISMAVMARAFSKLGEMDWGNYGVAIAGLVSILAILGIFLGLLKLGGMMEVGSGLLSLAGSLLILSVAIAIIGGVLTVFALLGDKMEGAVLAFGGILLVIFLFFNLMSGISSTAMTAVLPVLALGAAFLVMAAAVGVLAVALAFLSLFDFDSIMKGILAITIALAAMGLIAGIMGSMWAPILIGAGVMAALGIAIFIVSGAIMRLCTAIEALRDTFPTLAEWGEKIGAGISKVGSSVKRTAAEMDEATLVTIASMDAMGDPTMQQDQIAYQRELTQEMKKESEHAEELKETLGDLNELSQDDEALSALVSSFRTESGDVDLSGLTTALLGDTGDLEFAGETLKTSLMDVLSTGEGEASDIGKNITLGFGQGISDSEAGSAAMAAARNLVVSVLATMKEAAGEHSPSRITFGFGVNLDRGWANGILAYGHVVDNAGKTVTESAIESISSGLEAMGALFDEDYVITPVIQPIIDGNGIASGVDSINTVLSKQKAMGASFSFAENQNAARTATLEAKLDLILAAMANGHDLYLDDGVLAGRIDRRLGKR